MFSRVAGSKTNNSKSVTLVYANDKPNKNKIRQMIQFTTASKMFGINLMKELKSLLFAKKFLKH